LAFSAPWESAARLTPFIELLVTPTRGGLVTDDKSRRAGVDIGFYTRGRRRLTHAFRVVSPNHRARFRLMRQMHRFTGYVCAQGTDGTRKSRTSRALQAS
jgi:hypothetical protein